MFFTVTMSEIVERAVPPKALVVVKELKWIDSNGNTTSLPGYIQFI